MSQTWRGMAGIGAWLIEVEESAKCTITSKAGGDLFCHYLQWISEVDMLVTMIPRHVECGLG